MRGGSCGWLVPSALHRTSLAPLPCLAFWLLAWPIRPGPPPAARTPLWSVHPSSSAPSAVPVTPATPHLTRADRGQARVPAVPGAAQDHGLHPGGCSEGGQGRRGEWRGGGLGSGGRQPVYSLQRPAKQAHISCPCRPCKSLHVHACGAAPPCAHAPQVAPALWMISPVRTDSADYLNHCCEPNCGMLVGVGAWPCRAADAPCIQLSVLQLPAAAAPSSGHLVLCCPHPTYPCHLPPYLAGLGDGGGHEGPGGGGAREWWWCPAAASLHELRPAVALHCKHRPATQRAASNTNAPRTPVTSRLPCHSLTCLTPATPAAHTPHSPTPRAHPRGHAADHRLRDRDG